MWRFLIFLLLVPLLLLPVAGQSQDSLDAAGFDALTRGKTFYYHKDGQPYGAEEYLDDHRVRWAFLGDECKNGRWYEESGLICFIYDDNPDPQCWSFVDGPHGLVARYAGDPAATTLYEVRKSPEPLFCPGPEVGV